MGASGSLFSLSKKLERFVINRMEVRCWTSVLSFIEIRLSTL
jgi:hypothetical protein